MTASTSSPADNAQGQPSDSDSVSRGAPFPGVPGAPGLVVLIGAGPGDPGLITVAGLEALQQADVVVFDALANPALLKHARPDAKMVDVGKRARAHKLTQDETNQLLVDEAQTNRLVVRLKGGDPYLFGRGAEEAAFCAERGVRCRIVPGVTSGIAAPAYAGIPVTHRSVASTLTFVTGHEDPTKDDSSIDYNALAGLVAAGGTACFYMGVGRLPLIVEALKKGGLTGDWPVALVQWGTRTKQRSCKGTLDTISDVVKETGIASPAIIVVGQVVGADIAGLDWFTDRPLFGQTVLVTRTRQQASQLSVLLAEAGAEVLEAPTIQLAEAPDPQAVAQAATDLKAGRYDWLVLTSANAVERLGVALDQAGLDARALASVKIAVIGEATSNALAAMGLKADLVPSRAVAESLAGQLLAEETASAPGSASTSTDPSGLRFLLFRADIARPTLPELLTEAGHEVTEVVAYETQPAAGLPEDVWAALRGGEVDWVTFTSASTADNLSRLLGEEVGLLDRVKKASIGPITTTAMAKLGWQPDCQAEEAGVGPLVAAVLAAVQQGAGS